VAEEQLHAWQQEGCIEWWGFRGDMPEVLRQAHIACLPSYREGLPKFLIEAAAAGLPLVTTDVPGCRAVVTRERNGFLVPPRDPAPLAAALDPLLRDQALRQRFGEQSRLRAQTTFADDRIFAMILGVYRTLVGHP
jgi:glycosyltransferase involved in cell wall biosynthesis